MKENSQTSHSKFELTCDRIQSLTDGIFAFAMTLLVINIDLPQSPNKIDPKLLGQYLLGLRSDFTHYVLSFILLSLFWVDHHQQFYYIKKINRKILWINILNLLFVALFPFSTYLMGDYSSQPIAAVFFILNIMIIGFFLYLSWASLVSHPELIDPKLDREIITQQKLHRLFFLAVSLFCFVLAFIVPEWSTLPYILTFFSCSLMKMKRKIAE